MRGEEERGGGREGQIKSGVFPSFGSSSGIERDDGAHELKSDESSRRGVCFVKEEKGREEEERGRVEGESWEVERKDQPEL